MHLLPLDKLGAREIASGIVEFGIFLPGISASDGYQLWVKLIHEYDRFIQEIPSNELELTHEIDPKYGDYWLARIDIRKKIRSHRTHPDSHWGKDGKYIYRYCLRYPDRAEIDWIIDPFAREFGIGNSSAITVGSQAYQWSRYEQKKWQIPALSDLTIYELKIDEFGVDLYRTRDRLDYLADLGINCIEISSVVSDVNLPIGYFGIDDRLGTQKEFQRFVDAAHQNQIAVVVNIDLDLHRFPYNYLYQQLENFQNSFNNFNNSFVQDFFLSVNFYWLDYYHVDGFCYTSTANYWDMETRENYAKLTEHTYQLVKDKQDSSGHWQRFYRHGEINPIQCANYLTAPTEILANTYSNCTWQNDTLNAAKGVAYGDRNELTHLGYQLGLIDYPTEIVIKEDRLQKTALQYLENRKLPRFISNFGSDRALCYRLQPYLIGLFTAKGIPMLWQGQELGTSDSMRWDYFYDAVGRNLVSLVRKLIRLRHKQSQFRTGEYFFYNHSDRYHSKNVLLFSRYNEEKFSLIALNFSEVEQTVPFWFPIAGKYREELHGECNLVDVSSYEEHWLNIPSNYGRIWTIERDRAS